MPGCEKESRCQLKKGTNATVSVTFTPNIKVTSLKAKVYGELGPIDVPFPIPNSDGCSGSNLTCPLNQGKQYTYSSTLFVDPKYPSVSK